ncbi:hypothetical protein AB4144_33730, partial [Rhizobiaceae sp. 2RAB30]
MGSVIIARATATICCSPPLSAPAHRRRPTDADDLASSEGELGRARGCQMFQLKSGKYPVGDGPCIEFRLFVPGATLR